MSKVKKGTWLGLFAFGFTPALAFSSSYLLYFEAQGIAGYGTASRNIIFYSIDLMEAMQKPSLGFDLIQKFSGKRGDVVTLAVQARLAFNAEGEKTLEPQLYNAYVRLKTKPADIWVGHNRPKFGLASSLDSHSLLLQPLSMNGFGFDRDWGLGGERDFSWGNAGLSLTTGSGMALRLRRSYFLAGRTAFGVLSRDNFSLGLSAGYGRLLEVMGYHILSEEPLRFLMAGFDLTWLWNNWENRVELLAGERNGESSAAFLWRLGLSLLEESRLKVELQPVVYKADHQILGHFSVGVAYLLSPDWTLRFMTQRDRERQETRFIFQVYYYKGIRF